MGSLFPLSSIYSFCSSVRSFLSLLNFSYFLFSSPFTSFFFPSPSFPFHSSNLNFAPLCHLFIAFADVFFLSPGFFILYMLRHFLSTRVSNFLIFMFFLFHIVQTHLPSWFLLICLGAQVCSSFITSTNTAVA